MDILLDNSGTDKVFRQIMADIRRRRNGAAVAQMKARGADYKVNWGVSVVALRELSGSLQKDHLLALKLWNKQWRETMIMATMVDDPALISEEQMDYWTKSIETAEMAEQAVANLFVHTRYAYVKALEYCRGRKHWVRYTGLMLAGRLAMIDKKAIDDMFMPFWEVMLPLTKDPSLSTALYRTLVLLAARSTKLHEACTEFAERVNELPEEAARKLGALVLEELSNI